MPKPLREDYPNHPDDGPSVVQVKRSMPGYVPWTHRESGIKVWLRLVGWPNIMLVDDMALRFIPRIGETIRWGLEDAYVLQVRQINHHVNLAEHFVEIFVAEIEQ